MFEADCNSMYEYAYHIAVWLVVLPCPPVAAAEGK